MLRRLFLNFSKFDALFFCSCTICCASRTSVGLRNYDVGEGDAGGCKFSDPPTLVEGSIDKI